MAFVDRWISAVLFPVTFLLLLALPACATYGPVHDAERGDYPSLARHLDSELRAGRLDGGKARDVARAVAERELRVAKGADAVARVDDLRACVTPLASAFEKRADGDDAGAARAAYVLVDRQQGSGSSWRDRVTSPDPLWRAVGARTLVDAASGTRRRSLLLDLDSGVRRAALRASFDAQDRADANALLEVVRLDPDGLSRDTAARAVGRLGGRDVVLALKDRWSAADEPLRAAIVTGWSAPKSDEAGGREELRWVIGAEHGASAIVAAVALLRREGEDAAYGRSILHEAILKETSDNRRMAILLAPLRDTALRDAVIEAFQGTDEDVRVTALEKLTGDKQQRTAALAALGPIAAGTTSGARAARSALAAARDRRVVLLLVADTRASSPELRTWAAGQLALVGDLGRAALLLADPDPAVRTRVACAVIAAPPAGR